MLRKIIAVDHFTTGRAHELLALRLSCAAELEQDAVMRRALSLAALVFHQHGTC